MEITEELRQHQMHEEVRLQEIETNIKNLEEKIDVLSTNVSDLVLAWKAASWLVSAVKWLGGLAVAITAIYNLKGPH
jgi:hypothetical protein